ncbi:hypothetical protein [Kamptonema formosum]|uniref:hypothetical protein n=1 Tax=Kamptonema formosum TaxID=331992 RepID=UPI00036B0D13|nr:hypothetical protein [Oscillatoria sp. PCC 10802]
MKNFPRPAGESEKNFVFALESPFRERNGLLEFKEGFTSPEFFAGWSFLTHLYGALVWIDHCLLTFPNQHSLEKYAESFRPFDAKVVEGPALFPQEFCRENTSVPADLWVHLQTLLLPSGGLVVLQAPHAAGDCTDRFLRERGLAGVHHVAIRADDVRAAAKLWKEKGFAPMSEKPLDYGSLTQWFLRNSAGQIIELIERQPGNNATFDCRNIAGLRLSELRK